MENTTRTFLGDFLTGAPDDNTSQAGDDTLHPQAVWANYLWIYCPPVLILLGTFGNIMTIVILRRKSLWKMSSSPYLVVLGVADIFVLYTGLLRQWLRNLIDLDIRGLSLGMCKFHIFSVYTSLDFSVWILVAVSFERFIFVCFPFKAKTLCTRKRAFLAMALIFLCLCSLNCHFFYGYGIVPDTDENVSISRCTILYEDYEQFADDVWPWIDLSVFSMIPFCVIVICNICLISKILQTKRRNKVAHSTEGGNEQRGVKSSSMTALLISLNTLFLMTTSPISIYLIGYPYWSQNVTEDEDAQLTLWWAVVNVLMYLNNSVNFIFYCISGPRFRRELSSMCGRRVPDGDTMTATVTAAPPVSIAMDNRRRNENLAVNTPI